MKQYKVTSDNRLMDSPDDCYIDPSDPIHELKAVSIMGGLGSRARLDAYNATLKQPVIGSNKGQIQREQNIRPGTEEWFKLWFGQPGK